MPRDVTLPEELGRHGRRSRVIWHPGSIPPYSSLWITIQRFLMLNQPTRSAFAQDFLMETASTNKAIISRTPPRLSLNDYQFAGDQCPVRVTRFARVLKEASAAFRGCHIGDFPKLVRPYFGDFAVCPYCLAEGFHSVLYSFEGLRTCPAHGTRMESLKNNGAIPTDLFTNALRNPFGGCQHLQKILRFPQARTPKQDARRDHVLGEIANWLLDVESRCWLGQHGEQQVGSLIPFTRRLGNLKTILGAQDAVPIWADANRTAQLGATTTNVIRFGSMRVRKGDLVHIDDRRAVQHHTDLNIYGKTIYGDFKSIRRNLKRIGLNSHGRHWLARLANATSTAHVITILDRGGEQARRAWLLQAWWRQVNEREFNPKVGLHTRPIRFAVDEEIPLWIAALGSQKKLQVDQDVVHIWIARWISASGLLAFWRLLCDADKNASSPNIPVLNKLLWTARCEPEWGLGISKNDELMLSIDKVV
jgi:hypothetical protein